MISIPAILCRSYRNYFKRHYLRNKTVFLDFLLNFVNVHQTSSIFLKKVSRPSLIISEIINFERRVYLNF